MSKLVKKILKNNKYLTLSLVYNYNEIHNITKSILSLLTTFFILYFIGHQSVI